MAITTLSNLAVPIRLKDILILNVFNVKSVMVLGHRPCSWLGVISGVRPYYVYITP